MVTIVERKINLLPGQASILTNFKAHTLAAVAGTGAGKSIDIKTPIPTPSGWKTMEELSIGDEVFDLKGEATKIVYVSPITEGNECYRVTFDDKTSLVVDAEHLWRAQTFKQRKNPFRQGFSVVETEQMRKHLIGYDGRLEYSIPLTCPVKYEEKDLLIPPYTLGAWLGDGFSRQAMLCSAELEVMQQIEKDGISVSEGRPNPGESKALNYAIGVVGHTRDILGRYSTNESITSKLKKLEVWHNKHIPESYLTASIEQRMALLQGLMDTDGYCAENGTSDFTTVKSRLADNMRELTSSLGIKSTLRSKRVYLYGKDCGIGFIVAFTTELPVFRLGRKKERLNKKCRSVVKNRYVVSIEPVKSRPVRCIKVDSLWEVYLAGKDYIPTHNSILGYWWLHSRMEAYPGASWGLAEPTYGLLSKVILNSSDPDRPPLEQYFKEVGHHPDYHSVDRILFTDFGKVFVGSADNPDSMQGAAVKGYWLDEAGLMRLLAYQTAAQRTSMLNGQILLTTTPYNLGWLKTEVVDKADGKDIVVERWRSIDRPGFPRESYEREKRRLPPWRFSMLYDAQFERPAGLIYDSFNENACLIDRIPIPKEWLVYAGHDFGPDNPAALFTAQNPASGDFFHFAEYLPGPGVSVHERVEAFNEISKGYNVLRRVGGSPQEEETRQAYNAHGWVITAPKIKHVEPQIDKVIGMHRLNKIFVFRDLVHYLDEKRTFSRKLDSDGEPTEDIEDESKMHLMASERYLMSEFIPETVDSTGPKITRDRR